MPLGLPARETLTMHANSASDRHGPRRHRTAAAHDAL